MPYTSAGEAIGEGFKNGVSLVTGIHQMMAQKKQQTWENDLKTMTTGVELANIKGISAAKRMEVINGTVKPTWDKWHPDAPFPTLTADNIDSVNPILNDIQSIHKGVMKGDVSPTAGYGLITDRVLQGQKDINSTIEDKTRLEGLAKGALDSVKNMQTEADKKAVKDKEGADAQAGALKRSTELGFQFSNLMKTGTIDPEAAKKDPTLAAFASMFDKGKLTDEEKSAIGTIINHERQYLNSKIEDPQLRTPVMYADKYKAAIAEGYKPADLQLQNIIMPGTNPAKAAGAPAPATLPTAIPTQITPRPVTMPGTSPVPGVSPVPVGVPSLMGVPAATPGGPNPSLSLSGSGASYAPKEPGAGYLG